MTYWGINAMFLAVVAMVAVAALVQVRRGRRVGLPVLSVLLPLGIVLVMTAVFDNVMIGVGLVGYDRDLISGAFIGIAPLEDFAYAVAAVVLLPSLWVLLGTSASEPKDVT